MAPLAGVATTIFRWLAPHLMWAGLAAALAFGWDHYWSLRGDLADARTASEQQARQMLEERRQNTEAFKAYQTSAAAKAQVLMNTARFTEASNEQLRRHLKVLEDQSAIDPELADCLDQRLPAGWLFDDRGVDLGQLDHTGFEPYRPEPPMPRGFAP